MHETVNNIGRYAICSVSNIGRYAICLKLNANFLLKSAVMSLTIK